jgi:hypothetical protein
MKRGDLIESVGGVAVRRDDGVPYGWASVFHSPTGELTTAYICGEFADVLAADSLCAEDFRQKVLACPPDQALNYTGEHFRRALLRTTGDLPSELEDADTEAELTRELDQL